LASSCRAGPAALLRDCKKLGGSKRKRSTVMESGQVYDNRDRFVTGRAKTYSAGVHPWSQQRVGRRGQPSFSGAPSPTERWWNHSPPRRRVGRAEDWLGAAASRVVEPFDVVANDDRQRGIRQQYQLSRKLILRIYILDSDAVM